MATSKKDGLLPDQLHSSCCYHSRKARRQKKLPISFRSFSATCKKTKRHRFFFSETFCGPIVLWTLAFFGRYLEIHSTKVPRSEKKQVKSREENFLPYRLRRSASCKTPPIPSDSQPRARSGKSKKRGGVKTEEQLRRDWLLRKNKMLSLR